MTIMLKYKLYKILHLFHLISDKKFKKKSDKYFRKWQLLNNPKDVINYKTFTDLYEDISANINKISEKFDLIVGIPRSGMIPAYIVAEKLKTKVVSLDELIHNVKITQKLKILLVDDSLNSGLALQRSIAGLQKSEKPLIIKTLAIYAIEKAISKADYYFVILPQPRIFEWNYLNHALCKTWAYDIDGVLCQDPLPEENDDGSAYRKFILNAKPLFIPEHKIKILATARLEKYRPETEIWLKKNNVHYDTLLMLDLPNKEERIKQQAHTKTKIQAINNPNVSMFVESSLREAEIIASQTSKPVMCTEINQFIHKQNDKPRGKAKIVAAIRNKVLEFIKENKNDFDLITYTDNACLIEAYMLGLFLHKQVLPASLLEKKEQIILSSRMQKIKTDSEMLLVCGNITRDFPPQYKLVRWN